MDMDLNLLRRRDDESVEEYTDRVCKLKQDYRLTWEELKDIINSQTGENRSESYYRKGYNRKLRMEQSDTIAKDLEVSCDDSLCGEDEPQEEDTLMRIQKERIKLSEYRVQTNADLRRIAREETLIEIAREFADKMSAKKMLEVPSDDFDDVERDPHNRNSAILAISDWHYGIVVENYWNRYDPDIARQRICKLRDEVIARCYSENVGELNIVNLGDLICGRIHLPLRLQSRFDVVTQIMEVSEILCEFITDIAVKCQWLHINYYDCVDNHSRLEPDKNNSLELETLARLTKWYMKARLCRMCEKGVVSIYDNDYGNDIVCFDCKGYSIAGVHGDKDTPNKVVEGISLMTHRSFDLILTAHFHHFSCDERTETVVVSNGSLMGTDEYARKLRLSARPSQNLIIVTDKSVVDSICRIIL